ncbi:uncharacterized protein LOC133792593 [Humulus lupulus]|uniref:uncharacterized protein LOC133792593 n=1 Tax=Humulus lupulus TaxID=3486 RepID=UPI002B417A36|nr:uncharacterized protein LOC133792593 [Humulus lupulus]
MAEMMKSMREEIRMLKSQQGPSGNPQHTSTEAESCTCKIYQHQHNKQMSCPVMAQFLPNTLYYKRFFPYYSFNVLGGLDNEGKGCVFTYVVVGSYEKVGYSSQDSGSTLIMLVLDKHLKAPSPLILPAQDAVTPLSEAEAIDLVKTVFVAATERDIYTGDKEDTKQWKSMRRAYGAVWDMANPPTSSRPITLRFQATASLGYTYWVRSTDHLEMNAVGPKTDAVQRGVQPDQIIFTDVAMKGEHIKRSALADLFLDTCQYLYLCLGLDCVKGIVNISLDVAKYGFDHKAHSAADFCSLVYCGVLFVFLFFEFLMACWT